MDRVKALELLEDTAHVVKLNMEGFFNLLLRAGYPNEVAQKAASEHGEARLSAGLKL